MIEKNAITIAGKTFEGLKLVNEHGAEYWSARTLQTLLGYSQWRRFGQAIERAMISCQESGNLPGHHGAGKPIAGARVRCRSWTTITSRASPATSLPGTATRASRRWPMSRSGAKCAMPSSGLTNPSRRHTG
ncbi:hypothetical protein [Verminephrobacter eiseniae]|uniref:hypothetical protein n=1 Tax=Verminephrobacter eiseniae TaxID=364317 RepID=UPI0022378421|nr:hypothetical protein [Verminephrobacter eiseniae]